MKYFFYSFILGIKKIKNIKPQKILKIYPPRHTFHPRHICFMSSSSNPSLCIPRVFANITEERIRDIFVKLDIGELSRVDIVKTADEKYNRAYIHFLKWKETEEGKQARKCVMDGDDFKVIYDGPWFWKVSAYRPSESKPRMVFDDDKKRKRDDERRDDFRRRDDPRDYRNERRDYRDDSRRDSRRDYRDERRDYRDDPRKPVKKAEKKAEKKPEPEPKKPEPKKPEEKKPMQDENINCKGCAKVFVFSVRDQEFYLTKGFQSKPLRCRECARARKSSTSTPVLVSTPTVLANPTRYLFQPRTPENSPPRQRFVPKSPDHPPPPPLSLPKQRFEPKSPENSPPDQKKKKIFIVEEE